MSTLYIVPTPIGNLQDITIRAAKLLTSINTIACEDTRRTGALLDHLRKTYLEHPENAMKPRLISYYEDNEQGRIPQIIDLLQHGEEVALISDAGMPGISDPGYRIIRACKEKEIKIVGFPGSSSVTLALVVSGLPTDKFTFLGYLPLKHSHSLDLLKNLKETQGKIKTTTIIFEAPHKLIKTLGNIKEVFGDIDIVLCRELTKVYEEIVQNKISVFLNKYSEQLPKGEFVILWHPIVA